MGLTSWRGSKPRKQDIQIAKNYLSEEELMVLNNLVEQYLVFAEGQAMRRIPMHMREWVEKLDGFLTLNDRDILNHAGKVSHEMAMQHSNDEYALFHKRWLQNEAQQADKQDFEALAKQIIDKDKEHH